PVPLFVAAYDPTRKALIVTSLVTPTNNPAHVHELWVIPADGKPRPLGFLQPGKTVAMPMPEKLLPSLAEGSALAVSVEPPGASLTGKIIFNITHLHHCPPQRTEAR